MGMLTGRALLILIASSLAGCLPSAPPPTPPGPVVVPTAVPLGVWTQPGVANMTVRPDGVFLRFACSDPITGASMGIDHGLPVEASGHFAADAAVLELPDLSGGIATPTAAPDQTP